MKKNLITFSFLIAICNYTFAQSGSGNNADISTAVCGVYKIGDAISYFTTSGGSKAVLSYDKDLNTVVYVHRADCGHPVAVTNSGYYTYDISTDGGTTWSMNQGPIYGVQLNPGNGCGGGTVLGPHRGRYPKGVIYNPAGNTDTNNAHIAYCGPWNTDAAGTTKWYGQVHGTGHLDGSAANENYDSLLSGMSIWPEDMFVTKTGESWILGTVGLQDDAHTYQDSLAILKGVWNGNDFVYNYSPFHYRFNLDAMSIPDMNIAFGDDGLTGYIAMLTNQDSTYTIYPDSSYYIQVLKTEDGGNTWSCPTDIVLAGAMDSALLVLNNNDRYGTAWDLDIVVDKNNNLHIITTVVPINHAAYSLFQTYDYRTYGIFDFYTTDGGNTYQAQLLAHPETMMGSIGSPGVDEINEYLRPFASRIWDGSKLFFGWFDTDTAYWGIYYNDQPDLHLIGYDVDANLWTSDLSNLLAVNAGENISAGSAAGGICRLGDGSYYSIDSAGIYKVPVTYLVQPSINFPDVDCYYIDCAAPSGPFSFSGHPLAVPVNHASPLCVDGDGVVLSTMELGSDLIVSSNYPNPFTGKTSVDVTLSKAYDVSIEISNVVGQKLSITDYHNLHSGLNTLTIDAASLSNGIYFFTVKAGSNIVTKKMTIN